MKIKLNKNQLRIIAIIGVLLWIGTSVLEQWIESGVIEIGFLKSNPYILRMVLYGGSWIYSAGLIYYIVEDQKVKNPEGAKQIEIEAKDERILMIKGKAKAKVSDILTWGFITAGYLVLIITGDWTIPYIFFGITMVKIFMELYFILKYGKTM